jgi:RNA-directed DNA polymerase
VNDQPKQLGLPGVPQAKQGREVAPRWAWTQAEVWTERMLATLERGIEGGKWYSLIDKVWKEGTLRKAAEAVIRNQGSAGVDGQSTGQLKAQMEETVTLLSRQLREDRYLPQPVKRQWIPKLGSKELRPLGIPTVRDRVVQTALVYVLEPIWESGFAPHSYGFRPGRNAQQAVARIETLLGQGHTWVVDADLKGYFDNIPQDKLLAAVEAKVADRRVVKLIQSYLRQGVMESGKGWTPTERGTPQGAVLSPLLANLYLDPLDQQMAGAGWEMTRYADDFIIQCLSREEAESALLAVRHWVTEAGLTLHPEKTRIVNASQPGGFDFLGWHFESGGKWPREKSVKRFKETLREHTGRSNGNSMSEIIQRLNRRLKGWAQYFRGGQGNTYEALDGWLRMRLRCILRRRAGRKGRGRPDHRNYTNAHFVELGLISLKASAWVKRASPAGGGHSPTGEPDAGNPPVRFGGRGGG